MAYKYFSGNWHAYLSYAVTSLSSDRIANTRTIRVDVSIGMDSGWNIEFSNTYGAYIGIQLGSQTKYLYFDELWLDGSTKKIGSVEFTFYHDDDGQATRTINLWSGSTSGITYGDLWFGSVSTSITQTFETIPRMSQLSSISDNRKLGSEITITIDKKVNSFTHQVWYKAWGSDWIDVGSNLGTTVSFTPDKTFANNDINAKIGYLDVCIRTYDGTQQIGVDVYKYGYEIGLPDDAQPSLQTLELTDKAKATKDIVGINMFVQTFSEMNCKFIGAQGTYGSQIKGYYAEVVGQKNVITKDNTSFQFFKNFGDFQVQAYIVDSRGLKSNVVTIPIKVIQYFAPVLSFEAFRSGGDLQTITVRRNCRIAPIMVDGVQKNTMVLKFQTSPSNDGYLSDNSGGGINSKVLNSLTNSNADLSGLFPADKSFVVEGTISDAYTTVRFRAPIVGPEEVVLNYTPSGVGVGKIREKGSLDVKGDIYSHGELVQVGRLTQSNGKSIEVSGSANDVIKTGFYYSKELTDLPEGLDFYQKYGYLQVSTHPNDDNFAMQTYVPNNSDVMYMRRKVNTYGWLPWKRFTPSDVPVSGQWTNVELLNGWKNYGDNYPPVQYKITGNGSVELRGSCKGGNSNPWTHVFKLPKSVRIDKQIYIQCITQDYKQCVMVIYGNGDGTVVCGRGVDNQWLCFDGVTITN